MTDYLDRAREHAEMLPAEPIIPRASDLAHVSAVQAFATLAVAEALAALTLPQGTEHVTGETTGTGAPSPSPAEPSLLALDRADEVAGELLRWRAADRLFPPESAEWWDATLRLRDMADRIELAR